MKKRLIATLITVSILLVLGGFYWLGYIEFHDTIPTFTLTPGTSPSNTTDEIEQPPILMIHSIRGRFNKISAMIKNIGDQDVASVAWSISVKGGLFKRIDMHSFGNVALAQQSETTIISGRIPFGLGRLDITVTVQASSGEAVIGTAQGFKLLFFVIGVRT